MNNSDIKPQHVVASSLKKGDVILFAGNVRETVRKVEPVRGSNILVTTVEHPHGILAKPKQQITIVPRL